MAKQQNKKTSGFTLIELMIVVAILGILAALAIPAFSNYIKKSKTSEASMILGKMYDRAAVLYDTQFVNPDGISNFTHCLAPVPAAAEPAAAPSSSKQVFNNAAPGFAELGYEVAAPVLFQYNWTRTGTAGTAAPTDRPTLLCQTPASQAGLYIITGQGNLDDDADLSTFTLTITSTTENNLSKGGGIHFINELE